MNFDDPKPRPDNRKQQLIFLRPSLRVRIEAVRGDMSRSAWIERAILAALQREEKPPMTEDKKMAEYVICMRDDRYYLIGPFDDKAKMRAWGNEELRRTQDPRWQSIELTDETLQPIRLTQDEHAPTKDRYL